MMSKHDKRIAHTKASAMRASVNSVKLDHMKQADASKSTYTAAHNVASTTFEQKTPHARSTLNANLEFYRCRISSRPLPGNKIDEMLKWKEDYITLETNHRYIQWLFPLPEGRGLNRFAQPLQEHEAEAMRADVKVQSRVLKAFRMMLDFYGMELVDEKRGHIRRNANNWKLRYAHLNRSKHNCLRITRIIKSLGELGLPHLQAPWVRFLVEEVMDNDALPALHSSIYYWIYAIRDPTEMDSIIKAVSREVPEPHGLEIYPSEDEDEGDDWGTEEEAALQASTSASSGHEKKHFYKETLEQGGSSGVENATVFQQAEK